MPIFEYKCPKCGHVNEVLVKSASAKAPACPKCGHKKTEKLMSSFAGFVKQGGGHEPSPERCGGCSNHGCPHSGM